MALIYATILGLVWAASAQENSMANVPKSLLECYNDSRHLDRNNKLPRNVPTLLAILRKIENNPELNMDLRSLSVALLHRFRQDGIMENPLVPVQAGVTPYAPNGFQFYRQAETLKLIPGNAMAFPNDSITSIERCSLHSMLSSSIDYLERGDEATTCRDASAPYRYPRAASDEPAVERFERSRGQGAAGEDAETLTPEQLETMSHRERAEEEEEEEERRGGVDPNSWYPALPPNHPNSAARLSALPPRSKCPVENGVVRSDWGAIAAGSVLAGIAAGLQPQEVRLGILLREEWQSRDALSSTTLDNKWIATLAGDLAEVALRQGPLADRELTIGVDGHWNSSYAPRWYFLHSNEDLFMTAAEIRGDLDGLVLANEVGRWYARVPNLRLSQIIDMYYSDRGVFDEAARACNRKHMLTLVAPNDTITAQAFRSALVLSPGVARVTIDPATIEKFAVQASEKLFSFIPTMKDPSCESTRPDTAAPFNRISTDLTIVLDANWPFGVVQPILAALLEAIDVSPYNSNFSVISGHDGRTMIETSDSILDFWRFNETLYSSFLGKFDLPSCLDRIKSMQATKLNEERRRGVGGARSEIILVVPYVSSISEDAKDFCKEQRRKLAEEAPDATFLFLVTGAKNSWSDLVTNPSTDIFSVGTGSSARDPSGPIADLAASIRGVPQRLLNSQCGASYDGSGSSSPYDDYLEPSGINFYRLRPNYFYGQEDPDALPTLRIQGPRAASLTVCSSRRVLLRVNSTGGDCVTIRGDSHSLSFDCRDAGFIHRCDPLYLSVSVNRSSDGGLASDCADIRYCRYPDMLRYTISYDNLVCRSSAGSALLSPILLLLAVYSHSRR